MGTLYYVLLSQKSSVSEHMPNPVTFLHLMPVIMVGKRLAGSVTPWYMMKILLLLGPSNLAASRASFRLCRGLRLLLLLLSTSIFYAVDIGYKNTVQGDTSRCFKPPVDIKTKVPIYYEAHVLNCNFYFGVNGRCGKT